MRCLRHRLWCANGAAAADNPALCIRGPLALPGIDQIPLNQVKVTNKEMQKIVRYRRRGSGTCPGKVGGFACESYITISPDCFDSNDRSGKTRLLDGTVRSRTGSAPFTELVDLNMVPMDIADPSQDIVNNAWLEKTIRSIGDSENPPTTPWKVLTRWRISATGISRI